MTSDTGRAEKPGGRQLFVDMDGVLADFDAHYKAVFGIDANKLLDNVDWSAVRVREGFYADMPPMPDMELLWEFVLPFDPILLTGVPMSVEEAPDNKRAWARRHLGPEIEVRCCRSKEKASHASPGDILIDDWEKYRDLWIAAGGVWITHLSANATIDALRAVIGAGGTDPQQGPRER